MEPTDADLVLKFSAAQPDNPTMSFSFTCYLRSALVVCTGFDYIPLRSYALAGFDFPRGSVVADCFQVAPPSISMRAEWKTVLPLRAAPGLSHRIVRTMELAPRFGAVGGLRLVGTIVSRLTQTADFLLPILLTAPAKRPTSFN